jgi:hypothetical protein
MHLFNRGTICFVAALLGTVAMAQNNLENLLNKAEKLFALRDRIVSDYSAWAPEYAKEDTRVAKEEAKRYEWFCEKLNIKTAPPVVRKNRKGLPIKFVSIRDLVRKDIEGAGAKTLLDLSSGELRAGPDKESLRNKYGTYTRASSVLEKYMQESGTDLALSLGEYVIPSRKYANQGKGTLQYYAGVDLSGLVQKKSSPECLYKDGEVLIVETMQKKYALVGSVGLHNYEILLAFVYQPNGSAIFEFEDSSKPKAWLPFHKDTDISMQEMAKIMYFYHRENFFMDEVRTLMKPMKDAAENGRLTRAQQQRMSEIKTKLGLDK